MSIVEIKIPNVGESITEVTLAKWFKQTGDYVEMDEEICELESDKASMELPAEQAGTLEIVVEEGEDVEVGAVIAKIDTSAAKPAGAKKEQAAPAKAAPAVAEVATSEPQKAEVAVEAKATTSSNGPTKAFPSPAARKLMEENGISGKQLVGTGKDGRITKQDVLTALKQGVPAQTVLEHTKAFSREERREKMSRLRRTIATHLVNAKNTSAMLTTFNEVDMQPIMDLRNQYKDKFKEKHGVSLGFMSFFTKACCVALQDFPAVNAFIEGEELVYHEYCDISIAVSTPRGLVVPVIRNAESLSMHEIEGKVKELAIKGRDNELTLEDMEGGTFTISNGGVFGSMLSTPIINAPQAAILGMHKIEERPIAMNGQVVIRPMMYVALSYDHRIIDGKESVSFLVRVKEMLENPSGLLFGADPVKLLLDL